MVEQTKPPKGSEVTCCYCDAIMGWSWDETILEPIGLKHYTLDSTTLPDFCPVNPDRKHANMTPEEAKRLGLL